MSLYPWRPTSSLDDVAAAAALSMPSTPSGRATAAPLPPPAPPAAVAVAAAPVQPVPRSASGNIVRTREWHQIKCFHQYLMIRPHQNEWKALHQPRHKWLADMRQHSPGLSAERAAELFEEHFEAVGPALWRMRFNRRSAHPLEWISVDFFSKGRALDPKFLRFLMAMTWRMKTPTFRTRVPLAEFVRDRTEAEDRDAKDTFLLAHRFLYDACPQGLRLALPAPLAPPARAVLEEWAARGLVQGDLTGATAAAGETVRVHVKRDALDLVTYEHPLLPSLIAAITAQRPEARAHYRKIVAKEARSRTCFFRLYSNVRFLTVFGPLEPELAQLIAEAPVGAPPSSQASSTGSVGSDGAAVAKRGGGAGSKKKRKKGAGGGGDAGGKGKGMKRKLVGGGAGSGGGGGGKTKKRVKREEGDEGYVGAHSVAQHGPVSDRPRRAVRKAKADDDFCYEDLSEGELEEEEMEEGGGGAGMQQGGWAGNDGITMEEDDEWGPAAGGLATATGKGSHTTARVYTSSFNPLLLPHSHSSSTTASSGLSGASSSSLAALATAADASDDPPVDPRRAAVLEEADSALSGWFPRMSQGDHTTMYEPPYDPNNAFERFVRETGLAGGAAGLALKCEAQREAMAVDAGTMTGVVEEGETEEEMDLSQEIGRIFARGSGPKDGEEGEGEEGEGEEEEKEEGALKELAAAAVAAVMEDEGEVEATTADADKNAASLGDCGI